MGGTAPRAKNLRINAKNLVGERGFEPPTPWSRTRCSTRLSHSPTVLEGDERKTAPGAAIRDFVCTQIITKRCPILSPAAAGKGGKLLFLSQDELPILRKVAFP